tara:strand:+ start:1260 stop:1760 length:501 start_codon:yes stop_codon:yes gene_type:complete
MPEVDTSNKSVTGRLGVVKWFSHKKGYGFLTDCDTNEDIFCHFSSIKAAENVYKNLFEGEYVQFDTVKDSNNQVTGQNITGVKGGPLLCQNATKKFVLVNKQETRSQGNTDSWKTKGKGRGSGSNGRGGGKGRGRYAAEKTEENGNDNDGNVNKNQYEALNNDSGD